MRFPRAPGVILCLFLATVLGCKKVPDLKGQWKPGPTEQWYYGTALAAIDHRHVFVALRFMDVPGIWTLVVDVDDLENPSPVSVGEPLKAKCNRQTDRTICYLDDAGIRIYDFTKPKSPVELGRVEWSHDFVLQGTWMYAAGSSYRDVVIYDVSDPAAPVQAGRLNWSYGIGGAVGHLAVSDTYLVVTVEPDHAFVYRLDDPANPTGVGSFVVKDVQAALAIKGRHLLEGTSEGLVVADLEAEGGPREVETFNPDKSYYGDFWVNEKASLGSMVLSGDWLAYSHPAYVWGLIHVANPTRPHLEWPHLSDDSEAPSCTGGVDAMAAHGSRFFYFCTNSGLFVWDL